MKVYIKNKLFSLRGNSEIKNEAGEVVYIVKGKLISPTKKKFIYDVNENLLYVIRNKYWHLFTHRVFIYDAEGNRLATIKKNTFSLSQNYKIEDCVDEMAISGKFFSLNSKIIRNEKEIGFISRKIDFTDSFELEAEEKDIPFLTALVVALDNIVDKRQDD